MLKYALKRILIMIPILIGVIFIVFSINRMSPGNPVTALLSADASAEQIAAKTAELGLDKPFLYQFFLYLKNLVLHFDMGQSYYTGKDVAAEVLRRFPYTLVLGVSSVIISLIIGIPFGIISATKQYSALDYTVTFLSLILASCPGFLFSLMLVLIFSVRLDWLPAAGVVTWKHWILPILAMGGYPIATICRTTRSSMLEIVRQDYIRTARAKGLSEFTVIKKHALRNALIPIIAITGLQLGFVIGGTIVFESIFSIPGIGQYLMNSINNKDYNAVQGCVVFMSAFVCLMNLLTDIAYGFVDPRVRASYGGKKKKKTIKTKEA
mgnify:CR=1 FL=1